MPNTLVTAELQSIVDKCAFLTLSTSSRELLNSKGTGLPVIKLSTLKCSALIAIQGAQLLNFCSSDGKPLLWLSPNCDFTAGVALRGGIPVCMPWFGPNAVDPQKPKHGFARNRDWRLAAAHLLNDGSAQLIFDFQSATNELFDYAFTAQLTMTLGNTIKLALNITNTDKKAFDCSWVLHSYHPVSSLKDVQVKGLMNRRYLDNLENHTQKTQSHDVTFPDEVDRVFPTIENDVEILSSPHISIKHHNCPSVVVWNPGATNAAKIADIGAGNEQQYICVERGAVLGEKWTLLAGESKMAWVEISEIK